MPGVLELAQLLQDDGVAEVQVRARRVHAELDPQRPARGQARARARPPAGSRPRCGPGARRSGPPPARVRTSAPMVEFPARRGRVAAAFPGPRAPPDRRRGAERSQRARGPASAPEAGAHAAHERSRAPHRPHPTHVARAPTGGDGDGAARRPRGPSRPHPRRRPAAAPRPAPRRRGRAGRGRRGASSPSTAAAGPHRAAAPSPSSSGCGCWRCSPASALLAAVSTVFGMMMAVASDLPEIDVLDVATRQSTIVDRNGRELGVLTGNENRLLVALDADRAGDEARDRLHRGPPLLHELRRRPARHRPRAVAGRRRPPGGPGRLHDRPAARQEPARRAERPHDLPEAARGRDGVPHDAQVGQGADPAQLPQHDLLRQRRLRRSSPPRARTSASDFGLGHADAAVRQQPRPAPLRLAARARPGRADRRASSPTRAPTTRSRTRAPRATGATSCCTGWPSRATSPSRSYGARCAEPIPTRNDVQPPQVTSKYPYFTTWVRQQVVDQVGAGKAFEGGLKVRDDDRLRAPGRRPGRRHPVARARRRHRRPARRGARRARQPHQRGAGDGRRHRPTATTSARSTSPPRASASPARPSSRSSSPRRSRRATRRTSTFSSRKKEFCVTEAQGPLRRAVRRQQLRRRLLGRDHARQRDRLLGQLRLRRARPQGRHQEGRPARRAGWASAPRCRATTR